MKEKEKTIEVEREDGSTIKIIVKRPSANLINKAQKIGVKVWTESVREGLFTKVTLQNFMKANNIWNDEKEQEQTNINTEINRLERELALGVNGRKLKVSEGKEKAIQLRRLRNQLRDLISEKISLESNTAEGLSDNAKFNYLVSNCTYYENGERVYSTLEDYENKADDDIAFTAAAALGELIYNLDRSYEENLPENQFLKKFHLVDDELSLIDKDGNRVDVDGTRVNEKGWLINEKGQRIDRNGNLLSDSGQILLQAEYENDLEVEEVVKPSKKKKPVSSEE